MTMWGLTCGSTIPPVHRTPDLVRSTEEFRSLATAVQRMGKGGNSVHRSSLKSHYVHIKCRETALPEHPQVVRVTHGVRVPLGQFELLRPDSPFMVVLKLSEH